MKKRYVFMVMSAAMALALFASTGIAGASGASVFGIGGCVTVLPLFPTPAGAAPNCDAGPPPPSSITLPTDGILQVVGAGVDNGPPPASGPRVVTPVDAAYAIHADGVTGPFASLSATVPSYNEPCVAGEPSAIGLASGVLTIGIPAASLFHDGFPGDSAIITSDYAWVRVGLTAVVRSGALAAGGGSVAFASGRVDTGQVPVVLDAATATLVPIPPLPTCAAPGPLEVHVIAHGGAAAIV